MGTVLNDDEDRDFDSLHPAQDRRSGQGDRRQRPESSPQFRQEIEREYRAEIRQLREEENRKDLEINNLKTEVSTIKEWQKDKEETLNAAKIIVHTGTALKFTLMILIGLTAAIGGIAASLEAFRSWFK
jgi:hypothetical protein